MEGEKPQPNPTGRNKAIAYLSFAITLHNRSNEQILHDFEDLYAEELFCTPKTRRGGVKYRKIDKIFQILQRGAV